MFKVAFVGMEGARGRYKASSLSCLKIRQPDLFKSVQRYQLAVDEAKVRLNLAVCPGAWLMPGHMIINSQSAVGYSSQLKQAGAGMKVGINDDVNQSTKKRPFILWRVGLQRLTPKQSSFKPNPQGKRSRSKCFSKNDQRRRQTTADQAQAQLQANAGAKKLTPATPALGRESGRETEPTPPAGSGNKAHNVNKIVFVVGAVVIAGVLFFSLSERRRL